jgi:hypothetical protein
MSIPEVNGFDETGQIGENLRFTRVGISERDQLRPYVYNLLHFSSVAVTKRTLRGIGRRTKKEYIKMILQDPNISLNHYNFFPLHQLDILHRFLFHEHRTLFKMRLPLVDFLREERDIDAVEEVSSFLRRFQSTPFLLETYLKSYGFRMIVQDLANVSLTLDPDEQNGPPVVSIVDGGYPFISWWESFLKDDRVARCFSKRRTPIYGLRGADEYHPVVSMAGNISFISSQINDIIYPQNVRSFKMMEKEQLDEFCEEFIEKSGAPKFFNRVLFSGDIERDLQYSIPFMEYYSGRPTGLYEPFRLNPSHGIEPFERKFGRLKRRDVLVVGNTRNALDERLREEAEDRRLVIRDASEFVDQYRGFTEEIVEAAESSILGQEQRRTLTDTIERSIERIEEKHVQ